MEATLHRSHRIETGFPFTSFWHGFVRFFTVINRALQVRNEFSRLAGYNVAELAKLGISREEISQHLAKKYF